MVTLLVTQHWSTAAPQSAMPMDTDLHKAAKNGDIDEMRDCLDAGTNINEQGAQGRTALHRALGGGFAEAATFLIERGADLTISDSLRRTSMHWAAMGPPPGNVECCALVFEKSDGKVMLAQKTKTGNTPLHSAASTNRHQVIKLLLENGADEKAEDEDGLTPYDQASVEGHAEILAYLSVNTGSGSVGSSTAGGGDGGGCSGGSSGGGSGACCALQ